MAKRKIRLGRWVLKEKIGEFTSTTERRPEQRKITTRSRDTA